jgi:predicted phage terminase large subunit-like protein
LHNWHIEALVTAIMKTYHGSDTRLIVNMPPRMLKSFVLSVAYPAWVLGHNPSMEIMCISYGDELVKDLGEKCLTLMQSARYRKVFPNLRLNLRRQSPSHMGVIGGGKRLGISAGGAITGRGANIIIIDDPLKVGDGRGKQRDTINEWFDQNVYQRLNNKNKGVIILVMQRIHQFDLSGYLFEKADPWVHLNLPAIAEEDASFELLDGRTHHRKMDDVLHPDQESRELLERVKANQGSYVFASQYQQSPASDSEALVLRKHFVIEPRANFPTVFNKSVWSWDTANKEEESNDYSVGIHVSVTRDKHYYVHDVIRKKMKFPDLLKSVSQTALQTQDTFRCTVVVEDAASGQNIIQMLRRSGFPVKAHRPVGDKFTRFSGVSGIIESGFVHLPADAPWLDEFLLEITRFPNSKHDDQVDAFSQALHYLVENQRRNSFFG